MPQYEIEPPIAYYGSYSDDIITGSMLPSGKRGYVGSFVSGNVAYRNVSQYNEYWSLFNNKDPGSFSRNTRFFSNEIFYDSIIPDIFEIYKQNGGKFIFPQSDIEIINNPNAPTGSVILSKPILKLSFGTYGGLAVGSDGKQVSDNKWLGSFPFINEYSNIKRMLVDILPKNSMQYIEEISASPPWIFPSHWPLFIPPIYNPVTSSVLQSNLYFIDIVYNNDPNPNATYMTYNYEGYVNQITDSWTASGWFKETEAGDLFKMLFGSKVEFSTTFGPFASSGFTFAFGPKIRGWKYGLMSAAKTKMSVVYRRGRFGQFRDMLEQRLYSKSYNLVDGTVKSPIKITFTEGSQAALTASNPSLNTMNSGIYSYESATGMPWFDQ